MPYLVGCAIVGVKLSIFGVLHGSSGYESIWIEFPKFLLSDTSKKTLYNSFIKSLQTTYLHTFPMFTPYH